MASGPATTRGSSARREQLLDAAERAIVRHGPAATMDDIAREAGITKPILYRHLGDKDDVYVGVGLRFAGRLAESVFRALARAEGPRAEIAATIGTFLQALEEQPELYRFLVHHAAAERPDVAHAVTDFTYQVAGHIAGVLHDELEAAGLDTAGVAPMAHGLVGMARQAGEWWLLDGTMTREELTDHLVRLVWDGLPRLPPRGA